jgi:hypothetical protein
MAIDKTKQIENDKRDVTKYDGYDGLILYPSLGCPALVKKEKGNTWLEMLVICKKNDLTRSAVAYHLFYTDWSLLHGNKSGYTRLDMYHKHFKTHSSPGNDADFIRKSDPYTITDDRISEETVQNDKFKLQLAHMNAFPWILKMYREKGYMYLYKIGINLEHEPKLQKSGTLFNFIWIEKQVHEEAQGKPSLLEVIGNWFKKLFTESSKVYISKLSEFGLDPGKKDVIAKLHHPVYVSDKNRLDIGHITDIHMDSRMELYGKSVASVIEVKENCQIEIKGDDRVVSDRRHYKPLKNIVANFNDLFVTISGRLLGKADILVITGDLIDYNKSVHTEQTFENKAKKPSDVWKELEPNRWRLLKIELDNKYHKEDRNWFLFYTLLLDLYGKHKKPIFCTLGNHDYVKNAMAPWPLFGWTWNGVFDTNVTRYENALSFGKGYDDHLEFAFNGKTTVDCVKWYTRYINPFPDFVVNYGDQSMFMVDWGEGATISKKGGIDDVIRHVFHRRFSTNHPGSLHHASNLFREKSEYNEPVVDPEVGIVYQYDPDTKERKPVIDESATNRKMPFLIKNYTIYKSWIKGPAAVKILFTHATTICPRDDVSVAEINCVHNWADKPLKYGTFDHRRDEIIKDIENGRLHISVGGHSHRNLVMNVTKERPNKAMTLGTGEIIKTDFINPVHLALVTSSGGPLPKYMPGGPLVCACRGEKNKYNTGFYYDDKSEILYTCTDHTKKALKNPVCPDCGMPVKDMVRKPARRHAPGGNLLLFNKGKVRIQTVIPTREKIIARKAVMCEEQGVFVDDMMLEYIENLREYREWYDDKPINILSAEPFTYYGHMEFPSLVRYVTFSEGALMGSGSKVHLIEEGKPKEMDKSKEDKKGYKYRVYQTAAKNEYDLLYIAASDKRDFAFARYTFGSSFESPDIWDREINIGKKNFNDYMESGRTVLFNRGGGKGPLVYENNERKPYYPDDYEYRKDDFMGMLIVFRIIPNFKKRKDRKVCGY